MKVYIPNHSKQSIGGGWTFLRNFKKASDFYNKLQSNTEKYITFVNDWHDADIVFIVGATMTKRDEIEQAHNAGKPIVLRIDNMPKDSRNRGTAFSRMGDFAKMADMLIFQSEWAYDYVGWWFFHNLGIAVNEKGAIIYNGVDADAFYPSKEHIKDKDNRYLFVQYNRDENKRQEEAFYLFHRIHRENPHAELHIVGRFSPELVQYNFDFFAGEQTFYYGVIESTEQLGEIMRDCRYILYPSFADAAPNTLLEAISCGCEPIGVHDVGGSKEMLGKSGRNIHDMFTEYRNAFMSLKDKNEKENN